MNIGATETIEGVLRSMLPSSVVLKCGVIQDFAHYLSKSEAQVVQNAVDKRRDEFSTGRYLAKAALKELGENAFEILRGERRQPIWPKQICGSISHSSGFCAVAVGKTDDISFLGIDFEAVQDVPANILQRTARAEEVRALRGQFTPKELAAVLFSIREAVFKAYFPLTGHYLDYEDVRVTLDGDGFSAEVISGPNHPLMQGAKIEGKMYLTSGTAIAAVAKERR